MRRTRLSLVLVALPFAACDCELTQLGEYAPPGKIAGVVCDEATGHPVEGRPVRFEPDTSERSISDTTDEWGAFLLDEVPPGSGRLLISVNGIGRSQKLEVTSGETTVFTDEACRPGVAIGGVGSLEGTICNRHVGSLVSDANVVLPLPDGSEIFTTTDANGFFHVDDVPAGERLVQISAPGYQRSFLVVIEASQTAILDVGEDCARLDGTNGLVSGALCDPTFSGPLAGADVYATDSAGEEYHDVTDTEGNFVVGPMALGAADVHIVREPDVDAHVEAIVVGGEEVTVSLNWTCGNGNGGGGGGGGGDGGGGPPGDLLGRVCAPDGETWLSGATVWLEVAGTRYETVTDADGRWELRDVPSGTWELHIEKGSFSTTVEVTVDANGVIELPEEECAIGQDDMLIAVVDGTYDDVYDVLLNVGVSADIIDRYYSGWAETLLGNYELLATYDIVFIECGAEEYGYLSDGIYAANLKQYLQNGGSLYASDWAYDVIETMFSSHIDFHGDDLTPDSAQEGNAMDSVYVDIVDLSLSQSMGQSSLEIHYALAAWAVMDSASSSVRVYLRGDADIYDYWSGSSTTVYDVPHTVGFSHGSGKAIYTSFHQEPGLNVAAERLLQLLVFEL